MEILEGDIGSRVSRLEVIHTGRRRRFTEDEKLDASIYVSIRRRPRMGLQHPVSGVWFGFLRSQLSRAFGDAPVSLSAH